jgi:hypothetical protein
MTKTTDTQHIVPLLSTTTTAARPIEALSIRSWREWTRSQDAFDNFKLSGWTGYISESTATNASAVAAIVDAFNELYEAEPKFVMLDWELWGGAITQAPSDSTAFAWRESAHMLVSFIAAVPSDSETADSDLLRVNAKVKEVWDRIEGLFQGTYVNYLNPSLPANKYPALYYGEHLTRLRHIKFKYDPTGMLDFEQGVFSRAD